MINHTYKTKIILSPEAGLRSVARAKDLHKRFTRAKKILALLKKDFLNIEKKVIFCNGHLNKDYDYRALEVKAYN